MVSKTSTNQNLFDMLWIRKNGRNVWLKNPIYAQQPLLETWRRTPSAEDS
jgi:hypothetical protein